MSNSFINRLTAAVGSQDSGSADEGAKLDPDGRIGIPADTVPEPSPDISLEAGFADRIDDILAQDDTISTDPIEQLQALPVPNVASHEFINCRVEAWMAEVISNDDAVLRYISPRPNADARIQYHYVGDRRGIDAQFVRCVTTDTPTIWSHQTFSQAGVVSDLMDRLTRTIPPGTTRRTFDGTLDWADVCTVDSLKALPEIQADV